MTQPNLCWKCSSWILWDRYATSSRSDRHNDSPRRPTTKTGASEKNEKNTEKDRYEALFWCMQPYECRVFDKIQNALGNMDFEMLEEKRRNRKRLDKKHLRCDILFMKKTYKGCNDRSMTALFDIGSDISLMHMDEYMSMGSPQSWLTKIQFSEMGSKGIETLEEFWAEVAVAGHIYLILIWIVFDTVSRQKLFLGHSRNSYKTKHD